MGRGTQTRQKCLKFSLQEDSYPNNSEAQQQEEHQAAWNASNPPANHIWLWVPGVRYHVIIWLGLLLFVGEDVGDLEGELVGVFVGDCVGIFVGEPEGDLEGDFVGDLVGLGVQECVGDFVGESDRNLVGEFEGDLVGIFEVDSKGELVGLFVGDFEGDAEGDVVGDFVGFSVGVDMGNFVGEPEGELVAESEGDLVGRRIQKETLWERLKAIWLDFLLVRVWAMWKEIQKEIWLGGLLGAKKEMR